MTLILMPCLAFALSISPLQEDEPIETTYGPVVGSALENGVRTFYGIPFARPPVGQHRWAPAMPPESWSKPRPAREFSLASVQPEPRSYQGIGDRGEDCLYLNVYSPPRDQEGLVPVLFWVHGGGFVSGTAMSDNYDGSVLAEEGLCVICPNYRLGPLGFLAHPALSEAYGSSGNQALSDLVRALEWVRDNAEAFGGDPNCVTIAGQSSGGVAVASLMTVTPAQGLFHRAIIHSGGASRSTTPLKGAEAFGLAFAQALGIESAGAQALEQMRQKSPESLLEAWNAAQSEHGRHDLCLDGIFLEDSPGSLFDKRKQAKVPTIVGATGDESSMFMLRGGAQSMEAYRSWMKERFGGLAEDALEYYAAEDVESAKQAQVQYGNDHYAAHSRSVARACSSTSPCWRYRFTRVSPFGESLRMGAFHGAEIAYLFGRIEVGDRYTPEDKELSRQLRNYWIQFCRSGNPNSGATQNWPEFEAESEAFMVLDTPLSVDFAFRPEACDLIEEAWGFNQ